MIIGNPNVISMRLIPAKANAPYYARVFRLTILVTALVSRHASRKREPSARGRWSRGHGREVNTRWSQCQPKASMAADYACCHARFRLSPSPARAFGAFFSRRAWETWSPEACGVGRGRGEGVRRPNRLCKKNSHIRVRLTDAGLSSRHSAIADGVANQKGGRVIVHPPAFFVSRLA
jgi:hypothetical protein